MPNQGIDTDERYVAVLTGDLVGSTAYRYSPEENSPGQALDSLVDALRFVTLELLHGRVVGFDLFRGDSFQGIVYEPSSALSAALSIRMHLRSRSSLTLPHLPMLDARIAIGIGELDPSSGERVSEFDGSAFRRSGPLLDRMANRDARLRISTPWENVTAELETELALLDSLVSKWSAEQAEAVTYSLLGMKQMKIAEHLNVSQSAVAQRLGRAEMNAVKTLLSRYQFLIDTNISRESDNDVI